MWPEIKYCKPMGTQGDVVSSSTGNPSGQRCKYFCRAELLNRESRWAEI